MRRARARREGRLRLEEGGEVRGRAGIQVVVVVLVVEETAFSSRRTGICGVIATSRPNKRLCQKTVQTRGVRSGEWCRVLARGGMSDRMASDRHKRSAG